jgi:hypothetical protein
VAVAAVNRITRYGHPRHATRLPAEAVTLGTTLRWRRVGRSSDFADMGLATRLIALLPGPLDQCTLGFRFRLPLRGSPGFTPDSL